MNNYFFFPFHLLPLTLLRMRYSFHVSSLIHTPFQKVFPNGCPVEGDGFRRVNYLGQSTMLGQMLLVLALPHLPLWVCASAAPHRVTTHEISFIADWGELFI